VPDRRGSADPGRADFRREQRGVAVSMAAALCVSAFALAVAAVAGQDAKALPFADRLQATLQVDSLVVVWLAAAIANVARLRFFSPEDIAGSGSADGSTAVRQASAVAQNTFEQTTLAIVVHLLVTATFIHTQTVVSTMAVLFAAGRLLFWIGYRRGAKGRALGFGLTFYPSVLGLLASMGVLLVR
jgi:uncharacterized membrane protein YecN with MAPEG domain